MKKHLDEYVEQTKKATAYIQKRLPENFKPKIALTLGSGLGKLAELIAPVATIPYFDIPNFPASTVPGHAGTLIAGHLEGVPMIGFAGRKHFYEVARDPDATDIITFFVHVAANLGCTIYAATNAAGGLDPAYTIGDLMAIRSHISFFQPNPLMGPHHNFGTNWLFQPTNTAYTQQLRTIFTAIDPSIKEGVYVAVTGRTYESQAECLMLRAMGAHAVGMSTVPEIIVAHNRGMQTLGVSLISNVIARDGTNATNHEEVMTVLNSKKMEDKLTRIFKTFFARLTPAY